MTTILGVRADAAGLLRRSSLLADGFTPDEIDRLLRSGQITSVRRGVYRYADAEPGSPEKAHALRCRAADPELVSAAFGFVSAAVLLRLPVWNIPLARLHIVRDRAGSGQIRRGIHVHGSPLSALDIVETDGLRVTSPARTVADLARSASLEAALVTADGALYRAWRNAARGESNPGASTAEEIDDVLGRLGRRRGIPAARRVLGMANERSESPGETRSRLAMRLAGLPDPVLQWVVPGTDFRTDFAWPGLGVVGEFDGKVKYGRTLRPGDDVGEVVWREKIREDRIRATGLIVVRWTWKGITSGEPDGMLSQLFTRLIR